MKRTESESERERERQRDRESERERETDRESETERGKKKPTAVKIARCLPLEQLLIPFEENNITSLSSALSVEQ